MLYLFRCQLNGTLPSDQQAGVIAGLYSRLAEIMQLNDALLNDLRNNVNEQLLNISKMQGPEVSF
jgi:ABC-type phosphate transport system auxiliary subunit